MKLREEHFEKAIELLGSEWLKEMDSEYSVNDKDADPLKIDHPPKVVTWYRIAKEDLNGDSSPIFSKTALRNDSVRFLWIGRVYELVNDLHVISPDGKICEEVSPKDLFQEILHNENQFENAFYELEVAAEYVERGHEPAFVDESQTTGKTPDIELLDLEGRIQIECKRCEEKSSEEQASDNKLEKLFSNIRAIIDSDSYIIAIKLSREPEGIEVDSISNFIQRPLTISTISEREIDLPFGRMYLFPFFDQGIIEQPIGGLDGEEILTEFYESYVRPVLSVKLDEDKSWREMGNWVMYSQCQESGSIARHKNPIWIGVLNGSNSSESSERVRNQFKGVSGKFDDNLAILHIKIPDFREGDALQDLRLRKQAAGELKQRSEISLVVLNGLDVIEEEGEIGVQTPESIIPNYYPEHKLPDDLNLLENSFEDAIAYDEVVSDANEEYMADEAGLKRILENDEGTFSFRFTPEESSEVNEIKTIIEEESKTGEVSISLAITPKQTFRLTRSTKEGKWICEVDCENIPEFTPMHFFIVWSEDMTRLSVSPEPWNDGIDDVCKEPIAEE